MKTEEQTLEKAKTLLAETDLSNEIDCIVLFDFFNNIANNPNNPTILLSEVHKIIGEKLVNAVNKWKDSPMFKAFSQGSCKGVIPKTSHKDKVKGDILIVHDFIGIIKEVKHSKHYKIFTIHTTSGEVIPIMAV